MLLVSSGMSSKRKDVPCSACFPTLNNHLFVRAPSRKRCPLPVHEENLFAVWEGGRKNSSGQINSWELEALCILISNLDNILGMFPVFYMTVEHLSECWPWGIVRFHIIKVSIMFSIFSLLEGTQFRKKYGSETKSITFNWKPYTRSWLKAWAFLKRGRLTWFPSDFTNS